MFRAFLQTRDLARRGFTLIELLVSVSIFAMVMLVATGSVFSIVEANKKTHSLKSVMTNLNFALESIARDTRVGFKYVCTPSDPGSNSCANGGTVFRYKANRDVDGDGVYNASDSNDQIEYSLQGAQIKKKIYGNVNTETLITTEEIVIESMTFYVVGTNSGDNKQPKVVISIQGYSGTGTNKSQFNIQTTLSQRAIDS